MEVVNHHEGLQVDDGRYSSPHEYYSPSRSQDKYPHSQGTSNIGQLSTAYIRTPSPNVDYGSQPRVVPPGEISKRSGWLVPALLGGLIAAFVVGGALGGGLGATLAQCQRQLSSANALDSTSSTATNTLVPASNCSSSAPAPTTSDGLLLDYQAPPATEINNINVDCTQLTASAQISQYKDKYTVQCGMDYPGGVYLDGSDRFQLDDLGSLWAYSFQNCIDACSATSRTAVVVDAGARCMSVTFGTVMKGSYSNCWLKNATQITGQGTADDRFISARLNI